jgi:hypothetical protein
LTEPELSDGARRFMADMARAGVPVTPDDNRLLYDIAPITGALSGQAVRTGVSLSEVANWPQIPPHWVHLPGSITFPETNTDSVDCPEGWKRHSRDFGFTDMSMPPALAWIRHVRGLLSIAIAAAA